MTQMLIQALNSQDKRLLEVGYVKLDFMLRVIFSQTFQLEMINF